MTTGSRRERGLESTGDLLAGVTDIGLRRQLERFGKLIEAREKEKKPEEPAPQTAKIIQLPLWPEPKRGVPNSMLRSALFAAVLGRDRHYMKRELLTAQQGIEIRFTGMQLAQSDLDAWEQALHLARQHPLGTRCHFTAHGFLKALGRRTGGADHEQLKDEFARLGGCFVEITYNRMTYGGSLLEFVRDEDTERYILEINPKIITLYTAGWTTTDWQQRLVLKGKPLALWLHGFYASHAQPHPLKVETLHRLCGSRTAEMRKFKQNLTSALKCLRNKKIIQDYEIKDGLVYVDNVPSKSQQKHLNKVRPRRK